MIEVDDLEPRIEQFFRGFHLDEIKDKIDGLCELLSAHDSLFSLAVKALSVQSLDDDLSEVLLNIEVGELEVGNIAIVVPIISEDILHHVYDLVFVLFHDALERFGYLFLTELLVLVVIVRDDELKNSCSDLLGEGIVIESESVDGICMQRWLWLFEWIRAVSILVVLRNVELITSVNQD